MEFTVESVRLGARAGLLTLNGRGVPTPVFMPVGTYAAVKTVSPLELEQVGARIILGNAYHLHLRPGSGLVAKLGGIHRFTGWKGGVLTDSGGFQIFSLSPLRSVTEEGIAFRSHLDGSSLFLTPEQVIDIERDIGADIIMPLDVCTGAGIPRDQAEEACRITNQWALRSKKHRERAPDAGSLFGIVQGNMFPDLRRECARFITGTGFPGYAVGGLSVGEDRETMYRMLEEVTALLPDDSPRYLMGVGEPRDILESVSRGVDMFDSVLPTRNARNASVFVPGGKLALRNAAFRDDERPLQAGCTCYTCTTFTRAYLRHLFTTREILAYRLATLHNLHYLFDFTARLRRSIMEGGLDAFRDSFHRGEV
ncbi:MAG: tRNA guanosine(34) transglycosylase Tgt [Spirochaetota bacterium]